MIYQKPGPIKTLRAVAVLSLVGGIFGAFLSLANADNELAVALGLLILLQGVLAAAVLMVFASMAENVALIAFHTGKASASPREAPPEPPSGNPSGTS